MSAEGLVRSPPKYSPFLASSNLPSVTTEVRKTLSPHTTGDDHPRPGTSVFQTTFFVVSQVFGKSLPSETPAEGPRNCVQLSVARADETESAARSTATRRRWHMGLVLSDPESKRRTRASLRGETVL